jgi:toxin ParE1/3/4
MPYEISERAKQDILHLYVEGAQKHGSERADAYFSGLFRQFELLALNPELYHERTEIEPPIRVCPYGIQVILYCIRDKGSVLIIRIRHGHEDWL